MKPIRQGDVILLPAGPEGGQELDLSRFYRQKNHLVLAQGEVTGHKHRIVNGEAELYQRGITLYLRVLSETALLAHEEHRVINIPQGDWIVMIQREYQEGAWRDVTD